MSLEESEKTGVCEDLPLRQTLKTRTNGLNKRAIIVVMGVVSALIAYILLHAFSPKKRELQEARASLALSRPSEAITSLADDYSKIKKPRATPLPTLAPLLEGEREEKTSESLEEKLYREYALKRIRRGLEARDSDLQFTSLRNRQDILAPNSAAGALHNGDTLNGKDQLNPRDDANRQDEKNEFLSEKRRDEVILRSGLMPLIDKYAVQAGTVVPGVLLTGINSDLPGQISGQISQNVFDTVTGAHLLLPQGTKIIGEYDSRVVYGQERVLIVWTRLILPNGESIGLEGMPGVDLSGYAGLTDQVNNHYLKLITGVVLGSVIGASAQVAHGNREIGNPDFGQLALEGAADNINRAGQEITRKNLNIQPTLEIRPGFRFNIFVTKDMVLKPYVS